MNDRRPSSSSSEKKEKISRPSSSSETEIQPSSSAAVEMVPQPTEQTKDDLLGVWRDDVKRIRRHQGHSAIVAIDLGTAYSGYAYCFTSDPNQVFMMRKWEGGDPGVINEKTPTCLLLTPDLAFHSFGFTARNTYHDLEPDDAKSWVYFEKFKMRLQQESELGTDLTLGASNGRQLKALSIFSLVLAFFKDHALRELSDQCGRIVLTEDIRWILTVPAIWRPSAKQFMRQAAYEAGLVANDYPDQLLIALEPEVASVYCRKLKRHQTLIDVPRHAPWLGQPFKYLNKDSAVDDHVPDVTFLSREQWKSHESLETVMEGVRYMVVDCGGGTVDITVHELDRSGHLGEIYKASGGAYGSVGVDRAFVTLLVSIFGHAFIDQYKQKCPAGWIDLMMNFEAKKRSMFPYKASPLNISLPFSFINFYKKVHKPLQGSIEHVIRKFHDKDVQWSPQGMLRLAPYAMFRLFVPVLDKIKSAIGDVLNNPGARDLRYLFLVGGFAESAIVQHEIRKEFGELVNVVVPSGSSTVILKGAVQFGLHPEIVAVRRSTQTYGIGILNKFESDKHVADKKVSREGFDWCTDIFDTFIAIGQPVAVGDVVLRSYTPAQPDQNIIKINIYTSDVVLPKYVTDDKVRNCGSLTLDITEIMSDAIPNTREIQIRMHFGDTEIKVSALDTSTGRHAQVAIDFLHA